MHSVFRDRFGRLVPIVRPKSWRDSLVRRSRERTDRIARARKGRAQWRATTAWEQTLDRQAMRRLQEMGIEWSSVVRWLDDIEPGEAFAARRLVTHVLQVLSNATATSRDRAEAYHELLRRLIAAGVAE